MRSTAKKGILVSDIGSQDPGTETEMFILDHNPKTITNLPGRDLNWLVQAARQVYTFDEITGDLAEEIRAAAAGSKIATDPIPGIHPEDFEAAYQWFIS
jgi:hypothetical protein